MQKQFHTFLTLAEDSEEWNPVHSRLAQLSEQLYEHGGEMENFST